MKKTAVVMRRRRKTPAVVPTAIPMEAERDIVVEVLDVEAMDVDVALTKVVVVVGFVPEPEL